MNVLIDGPEVFEFIHRNNKQGTMAAIVSPIDGSRTYIIYTQGYWAHTEVFIENPTFFKKDDPRVTYLEEAMEYSSFLRLFELCRVLGNCDKTTKPKNNVIKFERKV